MAHGGTEPARSGGGDPAPAVPEARKSAGEPDVLLDVQDLHVDRIGLDVEDLRARVALRAEVRDLLTLEVGVDAVLGKVDLDIEGVQAKALLRVDLDNVAAIIESVLRTVDRNPRILESVARPVSGAAESLGQGAGRAAGELGRGAGEAAGDAASAAGDAARDVTGTASSTVEGGKGDGGALSGSAPARPSRERGPQDVRPSRPRPRRHRRPTPSRRTAAARRHLHR